MTTTESPFQDITETDLEGIQQAALDYIEGWYAGDPARVEHSLHPDLAKRIIFRDPRGFDRLESISALAMVIATRHGIGLHTPSENQRHDITILDAFCTCASVKIETGEFIEYLHLGKLNGHWQVVNVLWDWFNPPQ